MMSEEPPLPGETQQSPRPVRLGPEGRPARGFPIGLRGAAVLVTVFAAAALLAWSMTFLFGADSTTSAIDGTEQIAPAPTTPLDVALPTKSATASPSASATKSKSASATPSVRPTNPATSRPSARPEPRVTTSAPVRPTVGPVRLRLDRTLTDARIVESSGLAYSARHDILWTHNDSGGGPELFAIGSNGATRARFTVTGASAGDWEALAPGRDAAGNAALFIGNIGDNPRSRNTVEVYRVTEPGSLSNGSLAATRFTFRYPDGPRDAEALLVHPRTNRIYIVSKSSSGGAVYAAPTALSSSGVNTLVKVASGAPTTVTDGAFLPDGRIVLRNYVDGFVSSSPSGPWRAFDLPGMRQAESLAAMTSGRGVFVGSEGRSSPIFTVPLP